MAQGTQAAQGRQLAVVTGASSGIGYELALCCARNGFDLVAAADEPEIAKSAQDFRAAGASVVEPVQADLATAEGVDKLYAAATGLNRPIAALLANAGRGLGKGFLDQDWRTSAASSTPMSPARPIWSTRSGATCGPATAAGS